MSSRFKRTHPDNLLLPPVEQDDDDSIANATTTSSSADLSSNNEDVQDEYEVDNIIRCQLHANILVSNAIFLFSNRFVFKTIQANTNISSNGKDIHHTRQHGNLSRIFKMLQISSTIL